MAWDWLTGLLGGAATGFVGRDTLLGSEGKFKKLDTKTPEQMQNIEQILSRLGIPTDQAFDYIQSILSNEPGAYEDFERPYLENFEQKIVPGITERFAGAGALSSSGLNQSIAQAGRGLQTDLAAQRANLKSGAINQLQQFGNQGQQSTFQNYYQPGMEGLVQQILPMLIKMFSKGGL